jgi:DNA-binding beta-propeller fold protein YncE
MKTVFYQHRFIFLIVLFSIALVFPRIVQGQSVFSDHVQKSWQSKPVFQVPESVIYNPQDAMIYVANINGKPTDRDGNGFISQLEADGRIVRLEWVAGLHAPKGMAISNGKLFVADIYRLVEIDIESRRVLNFYEAEGAQFLNDVTIDDDGNVYVSDMSTGAVYKFVNEKMEEWLPAGTFDKSNGMNFREGLLYLGAKGKIVSIDPKTKAILTVAQFDGSVDGLEIDSEGRFVFSDWSGKVQRVKAGEEPELIFNTTDNKINAADIYLITDKNILLVPTFFDNRIMAYKLLD